MTQTEVRRTLVIGLFSLAAFAVFGLAVLSVGKKSGMFSAYMRIHAEFDNIQGLQQGQPVWLNGLDVGLVEEVDLEKGEAGNIRVTLAIQQQYAQYIREDSNAILMTKGLLGDKIINITMGSERYPQLQEGDRIDVAPASDVGSFIADAGELMQTAKQFLVHLKDISSGVAAGEGTVGKVVRDEELYREVVALTSGLNKTVNTIQRGEGSLGKLLTDATLHEQVVSVTRKLEEGRGTLGMLLNDPGLYAESATAVNEAARFAASLNDPSGTVGRLTQTPVLHQELQTLVENLNGLVDEFEKNPRKFIKFSIF